MCGFVYLDLLKKMKNKRLNMIRVSMICNSYLCYEAPKWPIMAWVSFHKEPMGGAASQKNEWRLNYRPERSKGDKISMSYSVTQHSPSANSGTNPC